MLKKVLVWPFAEDQQDYLDGIKSDCDSAGYFYTSSAPACTPTSLPAGSAISPWEQL
jgi:hypothetical protein